MNKLYLTRKHTVIVNKKRFFSFILVSVILLNMLIFNLYEPKSSRATATDISSPVIVTVKSGDTLWSIANEYSDGEKDVRELIHEIKKHNSLKNSNLIVGQKIEIPTDF